MVAGTCPARNPGSRATFWYFATRVSVSRLTSSAGISTEISRFTPSFLVSVVSVGLTISFAGAGDSVTRRSSEFKEKGRERQTTGTPINAKYRAGPIRVMQFSRDLTSICDARRNVNRNADDSLGGTETFTLASLTPLIRTAPQCYLLES